MRRKFLLCVTLSISIIACDYLLAVASGLADRTFRDILVDLEEKTRSIKSYEADYTVTQGSKILFNGRYKSKGLDHFRREDLDPSTGTVVSLDIADGQMEWMYVPFQNVVFRTERGRKPTKVETLSTVAARFISGEEVDYEGDRIQNGHLYHVIRAKGSRDSDKEQGSPAQIWFDSKTGLVTQIIFEATRSDPQMDIVFFNFKINVPIEDREFEFMPPPGAKFVDWIPGQNRDITPIRVGVSGKGKNLGSK